MKHRGLLPIIVFFQMMTLERSWPILRQGKICNLGFSIGKRENRYFKTYCSHWPENWYVQTTYSGNDSK